MSYDVHFFDKNNEPITEQWVFTSRTSKEKELVPFNLNYTSNTRLFFCFGFNTTDGLHCLNGLPASEVVKKTTQFIDKFNDQDVEVLEDIFEKVNNSSWGDIHSASQFIYDIREVAKNNPNSTCSVSC